MSNHTIVNCEVCGKIVYVRDNDSGADEWDPGALLCTCGGLTYCETHKPKCAKTINGNHICSVSVKEEDDGDVDELDDIIMGGEEEEDGDWDDEEEDDGDWDEAEEDDEEEDGDGDDDDWDDDDEEWEPEDESWGNDEIG